MNTACPMVRRAGRLIADYSEFMAGWQGVVALHKAVVVSNVTRRALKRLSNTGESRLKELFNRYWIAADRRNLN
ncbi:MAG: hypothetical protein D6768_07300 [Chloroflexi bacterium]|nr:MAG: hypothetical protein D6768_07300 [Chloroflexota bacterium]